MPVTIDDEAYLQLILSKRAAPTSAKTHRSWAATVFWGALSLVLMLGFVLLVAERVLPGAGAALLGQAMTRLGVPGTLTINGTPVSTPASSVPTQALVASPVGAQGAPNGNVVIQVPVVQTVLVPAPTSPPPTPLPAGVSLNVNGSGAQLSVSNGATATPIPAPATPAPGGPGFVESFHEAPTLGPSNPWVGCLPGRGCNPSAPVSTSALPQPGEPGFAESFK
jgi:hypothetical protein